MKILVTGANGYLGQGIVKQILNEGHVVVAADFTTENVDGRAIKKAGSMFEIDEPFSYYENPDIVLHLAWRNGFVHNADSHIGDLSSHVSFLKKIIDGGVKKVVVMGTMHEVGFFEGSINENTPCHPQSMYGIAKNALRDATALMCKNANIPMQWLRGYYMVGNVENGCSIFSKIYAAEKEGKELFPFTTGLNQWDFLDYDDFCLQTAAAIEQDDVLGIINICSGRPQKLSERVERFIMENGYKIRLDYGKFPDRPYDSKAVWGDSRKIEEILAKKGR